jgi:hypothetical protein
MDRRNRHNLASLSRVFAFDSLSPTDSSRKSSLLSLMADNLLSKKKRIGNELMI